MSFTHQSIKFFNNIFCMAWLSRFDDFDPFDDEFDGNSTTKHCSRGPTSNKPSTQVKPKANAAKPPGPTEVKRLCDITPHTFNATITGVIIAKDQHKSIFSKKNVGSERHLISFTLRDSPPFFVNVTCWGSADFVEDISNNFQVGHVVQLRNAQIQQKTSNLTDEKFKPWTPVSFQVNVCDTQGAVEQYTGWDSATYRNMLTVPIRPSNDYYTLEDINISGMALHGEHVNILAAVKRVGQIRTLNTKTGKPTKKCDVILFDDTSPSFPLDLWQSHADMSLRWIPFETVLFITDVKISFNDFKSTIVATADCKTIFTADPDTQEAHCLRQFLRTQDNTGLDMEVEMLKNDIDPDLSSITEMFTVQQLKEKRKIMAQDTTAVTHYGVLQAILSVFNIDAHPDDVVRRLCGRCRKTITNPDQFPVCTNPECSSVYTNNDPTSVIVARDIVMEYSICMGFSDFTGSVNFCHLQSAVAESLLGCKPDAFLLLSEDQRTFLKWQHLLEQCEVIFKLRKFKQGMGQMPSVQILSMKRSGYNQRAQPLHGI